LGILWPHSNTVIRTNADARAAGARIYFFEAGTTTPRTSYQDADLTIPHTHPAIADAHGRAPAVFLDFGDYRERVRTSADSTLWDTDDIPNAAPLDPDDGVTEDSVLVFRTGDIIFGFANETRGGFVRCNGRTIGSATSGASERANSDCEDLFTFIWEKSTTLKAGVSSGPGASAAADWAANKTIPLPDGRSASLIGFDDMGASAGGFAASAPVGSGSAILAGSLIGANTHTILEAQLPAHAHSVSITSGAGTAHTHGLGTLATVGAGAHTHSGTTGTESSGHTHPYSGPPASQVGQFTGPGGNGWGGASVPSTSGLASDAHTHTFSTTSDPGNHTHTFTGALANESSHTHLVSGSTDNIGSNTAHNILSRSLPMTILMKL
jgi:hypothetical protein